MTYPPLVIRLAKPWIGPEEQDAVRRVLESGMLVQGARVAEFEDRLAERCGRSFAVACGSGTAALELALEALGVDGGEVLCPALSWPSPAHAIARRRATPALFDVDEASWNASPEGARSARTEHTRAAIVIDQFGLPAAHPEIEAALDGLPIITDAACSLGATVDGRPSPSFGTIACLSFHPRKLITTAEGGACLTDDEGLADALRMLRNHGQRDGGFAAAAGNHRMTEIAAAMGLAQLDRLDAILERRRAIAAHYLRELEGTFQAPARAGIEGNWQTFGVRLPDDVDRDAVVAALRERGIEAGRLSYALTRIGSMSGRYRTRSDSFAIAEGLEDHGLALPMHPLLDEASRDRVIEAFQEVVP